MEKAGADGEAQWRKGVSKVRWKKDLTRRQPRIMWSVGVSCQNGEVSGQRERQRRLESNKTRMLWSIGGSGTNNKVSKDKDTKQSSR
jgi:hypothetical protein